jgi:pSer/pThr/pTyr-binding forkhead associated (FHA) protein
MILCSNPGGSGALIDDPSISQKHALLRRMTNVCRLYDLASTSGTSVDGVELGGVVLKSGDILKFGDVEVQFVHEESS